MPYTTDGGEKTDSDGNDDDDENDTGCDKEEVDGAWCVIIINYP